MKYSSIDIESTGTDSAIHQLIQLAIVLDDLKENKSVEELPRFKCYIAHKSYNIASDLASLNDKFHTLDMIEKISKIQREQAFVVNGAFVDEDGELYLEPSELAAALFAFYQKHDQPKDGSGRFLVNPAGKNVGSFDIPFIKAAIPDLDKYFVFSYRSLDPTILFLEHLIDTELPSLSLCKKRAGFKKIEVSHDAYDDCMDIVKLLRFHFKHKSLVK